MNSPKKANQAFLAKPCLIKNRVTHSLSLFGMVLLCLAYPLAHGQSDSADTSVDTKIETQAPKRAGFFSRILENRALKKQRLEELRTIIALQPFVDIHTGPGRGYPIAHVLEKKDSAIILKQRTNWLKIKTGRDKIGWVNRSKLQASFNEGGEPIVFELPEREAFINRSWEFGMLGGEFEGAQALTNYASYYFTPNISGEINYTQSFGDFSTSKLGTVNLVHQMYPNWVVSPFFTVGTGLIDIAPDVDLAQSQDRSDTVMTVGGGVFVKISKRFLLRIEYDNHTVLTTRENNEEVIQWKAGFGVYF